MSGSTDEAAVSEQGAPAAELDADLAELVRMTEVLSGWEALRWPEVQQMTRVVGPQLLAQLVGRGLWDRLRPAEQALVCWAMADAHSVSCLQKVDANPRFVRPRIASLREAADRVAVWCGAYGYPRVGNVGSITAAEFAARLDAFPEGWRAEVIRRSAAGRDIKTVIAEAPIGMNLLRSVYGIDVRTP